MATTFIYDTVSDFSSGVDLGPLATEIAASSIVPQLDLALTCCVGTELTLVFDAGLSSAEETTLHGDASPPAAGSVLGDHAGPVAAPPADSQTFRMTFSGKPTVQTTIDGAWIAPRDGTFKRITAYRRTAGGGGSTIADVNKNGTTIYTTQGNRPTITAASGNDQIDATTDFDVTTFAQDDRIEVDIDAAETGNPACLVVVFEVEYS